MAVNCCILHLCPEDKKCYERVAALHLFSKMTESLLKSFERINFSAKIFKKF